MQIAQFVRAVRRQRRTITAFAALGALAALAIDWHAGPTFAAGSQLFVAATTSADGTSPSTAPANAEYLAQRVQTYAGLATSQDVLDAVAADTAGSVSSRDLADRITATAVPGTVLLDIRVEASSPALARDIADSVASHLAESVSKLESPAPNANSPITLQVTKKAVASPSPIGPNRTLDTLVGLLLGATLGLVLAVGRVLTDTSVRSRAQVEALGVPLLAEIAEDPSAAKLPLILADPYSPRAEAFRRLRTNLRRRLDAGTAASAESPSAGEGVRCIAVTSPLPGEGRTATACNLAIALAQNGDEVVLVDADLRRGGVADMLGLSAGIGLTNVLSGERPLSQALHPWRTDLPLRVLPSGPLPPNPSEVAGGPALAALLASLTAGGLTVVIDTPPLVPVTDGALVAAVADGAVVVVHDGTTPAADLRACVDALTAAGARVLGVALNRTRDRALALPPAVSSPRRRKPTPTARHTPPAGASRIAPPDTLAASVAQWLTPPSGVKTPVPSALAEPPAAPAGSPAPSTAASPVEVPPAPAAPATAPVAISAAAGPAEVQEPFSGPTQLLPRQSARQQVLRSDGTPRYDSAPYDPSSASVPYDAPLGAPPFGTGSLPTTSPSAATGSGERPTLSRKEARRRLRAVTDADLAAATGAPSASSLAGPTGAPGPVVQPSPEPGSLPPSPGAPVPPWRASAGLSSNGSSLNGYTGVAPAAPPTMPQPTAWQPSAQQPSTWQPAAQPPSFTPSTAAAYPMPGMVAGELPQAALVQPLDLRDIPAPAGTTPPPSVWSPPPAGTGLGA